MSCCHWRRRTREYHCNCSPRLRGSARWGWRGRSRCTTSRPRPWSGCSPPPTGPCRCPGRRRPSRYQSSARSRRCQSIRRHRGGTRGPSPWSRSTWRGSCGPRMFLALLGARRPHWSDWRVCPGRARTLCSDLRSRRHSHQGPVRSSLRDYCTDLASGKWPTVFLDTERKVYVAAGNIIFYSL